MNPELQRELAAWLSKLRESADAAGSFVLEQAPLIVQEKVAYGRVVETTAFAALLIAVAISATVALRCMRRHFAGDEEDSNFVGLLLGGIGTFVSLVGACGQFDAVAKVWFAPRLYIMEWLAGLLK
jgi:hypothetical protein